MSEDQKPIGRITFSPPIFQPHMKTINPEAVAALGEMTRLAQAAMDRGEIGSPMTHPEPSTPAALPLTNPLLQNRLEKAALYATRVIMLGLSGVAHKDMKIELVIGGASCIMREMFGLTEQEMQTYYEGPENHARLEAIYLKGMKEGW